MDAVVGGWAFRSASRRRPVLLRVASLCCSVAALWAFAYVQGLPLLAHGAQRSAPHVVQPAEPRSVAPAAAVAADAGVMRGSQADALPVGEMPPPGVLVPRLTGRSLTAAFAQADALGLQLAVRDRWGDRVRRRDAGYYRVARQSVPPGALHAGGEPISIRARERVVAMGY